MAALDFNFSKSGIGASVGVKGFRLGTGPRENYIHVGCNGIYYHVVLGKKKIKLSAQPIHPTQRSITPPTKVLLLCLKLCRTDKTYYEAN